MLLDLAGHACWIGGAAIIFGTLSYHLWLAVITHHPVRAVLWRSTNVAFVSAGAALGGVGLAILSRSHPVAAIGWAGIALVLAALAGQRCLRREGGFPGESGP